MIAYRDPADLPLIQQVVLRREQPLDQKATVRPIAVTTLTTPADTVLEDMIEWQHPSLARYLIAYLEHHNRQGVLLHSGGLLSLVEVKPTREASPLLKRAFEVLHSSIHRYGPDRFWGYYTKLSTRLAWALGQHLSEQAVPGLVERYRVGETLGVAYRQAPNNWPVKNRLYRDELFEVFRKYLLRGGRHAALMALIKEDLLDPRGDVPWWRRKNAIRLLANVNSREALPMVRAFLMKEKHPHLLGHVLSDLWPLEWPFTDQEVLDLLDRFLARKLDWSSTVEVPGGGWDSGPHESASIKARVLTAMCCAQMMVKFGGSVPSMRWLIRYLDPRGHAVHRTQAADCLKHAGLPVNYGTDAAKWTAWLRQTTRAIERIRADRAPDEK